MTPAALLDGVVQGTAAVQRRAMSKAITLLESTRVDHRAQADELLTQLLPHTGKAFRLGISGVPGVGKSTFIEALGLYLIGQGHRVAVLTIDPSSTVSGGSILGDKTRMEHLSVHEKAYIRPSPSSGTLGGVIPAQDYDFLYESGVKGVYGPGTPIPASAKDVLEQIRKAVA